MEKKEKKSNGKVSQEVIDLVNGLKYMGEMEGLHFPLERIETLSQIVDEVAEGENLPWSPEKITSLVAWQKKIIEEIRQRLKAQDSIIMSLKKAVRGNRDFDSFMAENEKNSFKVNPKKVEALQQLSSLFLYDNLVYDETIDLRNLKAWALTYGFDFETVKGMLGEKKTEDDECEICSKLDEQINKINREGIVNGR